MNEKIKYSCLSCGSRHLHLMSAYVRNGVGKIQTRCDDCRRFETAYVRWSGNRFVYLRSAAGKRAVSKMETGKGIANATT